ncbi:homeotic protein ocelliless [Drosophila obscura]|uniref:homeotic protein ocelliless n=1 Tax=Drosophila obscura TaxID=7282 RepID=UPI001BB2956C|nr:homeotic protein ocelliless [Drosophila obscura]
MDIMDIQAVESKLSDVTVTPIPRSQVQNFYNYQQQREQREQQPQIQISAIHHSRGNSSGNNSMGGMGATDYSTTSGSGNANSNKRDRSADYSASSKQNSAAANAAAAAAVAALQYSPQFLQAQLALLQQQSNTTATPAAAAAAALSLANIAAATNGARNSGNSNGNNLGLNLTQSQLKYPPPSTSPLVVTTQTSANITTPLTSTANLPTVGSLSTGNGLTKYAQLLAVIEEMGRDIRPTYTGSRSSTERLKRGIVHARILVRECLMETERAARQ